MAPQTVTLELGKPARIPESGLVIELVAVKDNRCPVEVRCIWAGHAEVTLQVSQAGQPAKTVVIGTSAPAGMNLPYEAVYESCRFGLEALAPANSLAEPPAKADYRATVQISPL
jgi:hypothetical protein